MDIIIGAGITGLAYANYTKNQFLLLEADNHVGGLCKTIFQDGFVWDYSGHFFHFQNKDIADFFRRRIPEDKIVTVEKHTQIKYKDRLIDFPFQKNIHQLSKKEFIECLCDLFDTESFAAGTSFESMLYAKFGKSIANKFLIPYNRKLYATDLNKLDIDAMGRFFPYAEKEEIIRNFKHKESSSYNGSFIYSKNGAIQYVKALKTAIPEDRIHIKEIVTGIDLATKTISTNKGEYHYDNLISTISLVKLLNICKVKYNTDALSWNKVLVFNLGFDCKSSDTKNHWIYFPEKKYCFYRVGFYSNIIPSERMSLYVEIGYSKDATINIESMLENVLADLKKAGIVSNQKMISHHSVIMDPAYVHISKEGISERDRVKEILKAHNIYSIGRYGSWNYSSIEDNIIEAMHLSQELV